MPIPPGLSGMLNEGPPVEPRLAASVLLIDERARPWPLLMMRRPEGAEFAPSAYVFPGGTEHEEDRAFSDPSRAAAVRELFEEVGMLLARRSDGRFARDRDCELLRAALAGGVAFPEAMATCGLSAAFDRLTLMARWITPVLIRRRYDTRFYLARRPAGQTVEPQVGEVDDWMWVSPDSALAADGPTLVHATRRILESVATEPDPARLIARLRRRRGEPPPVLPVVEALPDGSGFQVIDTAS